MSALQQRLRALVLEHELPEGSAEQLRRLLEVVSTDPTAPTTVRDPAAAAEAHVADSLAGLRLPVVRGATRIADLGAGAGFPGLVLAVARPTARLSLLDGAGKKVAFMQRAIAAIGVSNARAVHARAEEWSDGLGTQDVVTARALGALPILVEYAAPLLVDGGHLVAWKGRRDPQEEADGDAAGRAVGLELSDVVDVPPRPGADHRTLYVYSKVRPTPAAYPRRAGMARKRPITA